MVYMCDFKCFFDSNSKNPLHSHETTFVSYFLEHAGLRAQLFQLVHCTRCLQHIETDIYACHIEHAYSVLCADCKQKNPRCDICGNHGFNRSMGAEAIRNKELCPCKNSKWRFQILQINVFYMATL